MYSSTFSLTPALDGNWCSKSRPGRFTPGKGPVPIVKEAGQAPGPVWTGAENLNPPPGFDLQTDQRVAIPNTSSSPVRGKICSNIYQLSILNILIRSKEKLA
jgi:hypothetical protein